MPNKPIYIAFHPIYAHPLPEGHRFPMLKYELIPEQLIYEGVISESNFHAPEECDDKIVAITHNLDYIHKLKNLELSEKEQRVIGFPQSAQLIKREFIIAQGTLNCALEALKTGVALNVAGGTHHAYADHGEGFCLLNDIAIASNYLLKNELAKRILIVDLDVHQGNGSAKIFENNTSVFTFSMHCEHNYPFRKEKSDLDIGLPLGIGDAEYLSILELNLIDILSSIKPDFVFYLAGVDVLETDKLGKLGLSLIGCKTRDELVFNALFELNIPCAVSLGGGYSADIKLIVEAHCNTFKAAKEIFGLD